MESSSSPRFPVRTRLMIVEDQVSMREMLIDVLSHLPDFEVVAQAENVEDALRLARATQPDVIILDWLFPGGGGEAFLREMRPSRLHAHVLVLSGNITDEAVRAALLAGARGFFEKGANLDEFLIALRTVAAGGAYFGPMVAEIVERLIDVPEAAPAFSAAAPLPGFGTELFEAVALRHA